MHAIFGQLEAFWEVIKSYFQLVIWLWEGAGKVIGLMLSSIAMLTDVLGIFPTAVASALIGVCGGLVVLRIFGRS